MPAAPSTSAACPQRANPGRARAGGDGSLIEPCAGVAHDPGEPPPRAAVRLACGTTVRRRRPRAGGGAAAQAAPPRERRSSAQPGSRLSGR